MASRLARKMFFPSGAGWPALETNRGTIAMRNIVFAFLLLIPAGQAMAAPPPFGPKDDVARMLSSQYGERELATGISSNLMFTFYANSDSGTWSIEVVDTKGTACVIAAGGDVVVKTRADAFRPAFPASFAR